MEKHSKNLMSKPSLYNFPIYLKNLFVFSGALSESPQTIWWVLKLQFLRGKDWNE